VLNNRLTKWVETNNILSDTQNGFRPQRSTIDQLSTLTNIVDARKKSKKDTFVAYVDFSKAYDRINRHKLWSKLENNYGLTGKFLNALKSLYASVKCAVRVNDYTSEWFDVKSGLKQGCLVSTTLFNLFLNDISELFEQSNMGVKINGKIISHLFYADDLVLIAENEEDLQHLLTLLSKWCDINNMNINTDKSKIMHF